MSDAVDLHAHTDRSDGVHPPATLVRLAVEAGLSALAVTDHDTTAGLPEAVAAASSFGLELIPAVEIGVLEEGKDVHLLAYFIDPAHPGLVALLAALRRARERRLAGMLRRLRRLGLPLTAGEVRRRAPRGGPVGRPLLAAALVARGWVADVEDAFRFWISTEGPAYLPNQTPPAEEVLRIILQAGGIPVLAHPGIYPWERFLDRYVEAGLMGLEVCHPRHDAAATRTFEREARARGLLETGGSDYHGRSGNESPLGSCRPPAGGWRRLREARSRVPEVLRRRHGTDR